jgi:hypothetical protein
MIELTDQQRLALDQGRAVSVTDPETATPYFVLRKDVYERVQSLLYDDSEAAEDELRARIARSSAANGWDEPGMDEYDCYDVAARVANSSS